MIVATLKAVATHYGVALDTVREWRKLGMPGRKGRWSVEAIDEWREQRAQQQHVPTSTLDEAMARAKLAREVARAKREQRADAREAGEVIDVSEHERIVGDLIRWFVAMMEAAPSAIVIELAGLLRNRTEARKVIEAFFRRVRTEAVKR